MVTVLSSPQRLRHQRLGAFRQLGAQPVELAELAQERLVVLDAERQRHARGADVGRIGEDLRHREHAVLRVVVVDGELAVVQRRRAHRTIELSVILPESSAIASVSALKVEPISNTPVVRRLMRVGSSASRGLLGS